MTNNCAHLATKEELNRVAEQLNNKLDKDEKPGIIQSGGLLGSSMVAGSIAAAAAKATQAKQVGDAAQGIAQVAQVASKQANIKAQKGIIDALIAGRKVERALSTGTSNISRITSVAGKVASIASVLTTFASVVAVVQLTKQVAKLAGQIKHNERVAKAERLRNEVQIALNRTLVDTANRNIELNKAAIKRQQQEIDYNKWQNEVNQRRAEKIEKKIETVNKRIEQHNINLENAVNTANDAIAEANEANRLATIANTKVGILQNENQILKNTLGVFDSDKDALLVSLKTVYAQLQDLKNEKADKEEVLTKEQQLQNFASDLQATEEIERARVADDGKNIAIVWKPGVSASEKKAVFEAVKNGTYEQNKKIDELLDNVSTRTGGGLGSETVERIVDQKLQQQQQQQQVKEQQQQQQQQQVNNNQYKDLVNRINQLNTNTSNFNPTTISIAVGSLPIIQQIAQNAGTAASQPFVCAAPGLVPPVGAQARANNAAILGFQSASIAQTTAIQTATDTIRNTVTNAEHGLKKIQEVATTAWKATGADKVLNAVNTALVIHNGIMLSRNLGVTIGDAASTALQAMGIKDSTGEFIDVNSVVKSKMEAIVSSVVGAENYEALTSTIANMSRTYQAGANLLDSVRDLYEAGQATTETVAENTGQIGNALLEAGVVFEDAYDKMVDDFSPSSAARGQLDRFQDVLNSVDDKVSSIENISSNILSTKEAYNQMGAARQEFDEAKGKWLTDREAQDDEVKTASEALTEIEDADFDALSDEQA